jgi:hypothetical protein
MTPKSNPEHRGALPRTPLGTRPQTPCVAGPYGDECLACKCSAYDPCGNCHHCCAESPTGQVWDDFDAAEIEYEREMHDLATRDPRPAPEPTIWLDDPDA